MFKLTPGATVDFTFIFSVITAIGVFYTIYRTQRASIKEESTGIIKANIKLDALCNSTDEIRMNMKDLNSKIDKLDRTQVKHDAVISEMKKDIEKVTQRVDELEKHKGMDE